MRNQIPDPNKASRADDLVAHPAIQYDQLEELLVAVDYSPEKLIDFFKNDARLTELFAAPAVREGYSIEEHTLMVLRQFEKYFAEVEMPEGMTRAEMRLLLSLHDIGKGIPTDRGDQHDFTLGVLKDLESQGVLSEQAMKLLAAPLSMDALGNFLYHSTANGPTAEDKLIFAQRMGRERTTYSDLENFMSGIQIEDFERVQELALVATKQINEMAALGGITSDQVFDILMIYYQCDTLAYTFDAARDKSRSPLLRQETLRGVSFNHDKPLLAKEGLSLAAKGETSAQAYARLEADHHFERGYPSLDFLYELNPNFDPSASPHNTQQFLLKNGRVQFNSSISNAVAVLERSVKGSTAE